MARVIVTFSIIAFFVLALQATNAQPRLAPYIDLTGQFARFVDETAGMDDAARVAQFHKQMDALFPGFYVPRFGATQEQYDAHIAKALENFPALRPRYEQVQKDFPAA